MAESKATGAPPIKQPAKPASIDREKTCPLLLRVFYSLGGHHRIHEFTIEKQPLHEEVQIYTWRDATLRELTDLIKDVHPGARATRARLSFSIIYPDKTGRFVMKEVGECLATPRKGLDRDDNKTLDELHFEIGDFIDVAILHT